MERRTEIETTTSGAGVQTRDIAELPAVGAGVLFQIRLSGTRIDAADEGEAGLYFAPEGAGDRNATGVGVGTPILIGPTGFVDAVLVPWTTIAVPAGWAATVAFAGNVLQLTFNGAAGEDVEWTGYIWAWFKNGAIT